MTPEIGEKRRRDVAGRVATLLALMRDRHGFVLTTSRYLQGATVIRHPDTPGYKLTIHPNSKGLQMLRRVVKESESRYVG